MGLILVGIACAQKLVPSDNFCVDGKGIIYLSNNENEIYHCYSKSYSFVSNSGLHCTMIQIGKKGFN